MTQPAASYSTEGAETGGVGRRGMGHLPRKKIIFVAKMISLVAF